ncbi:MAG: Coenzyme F420 hydrogenase/dehydrogenase, beta subunit C-terminal domain [Muribaculum sp.]|nr:Coenzyme F420 hydrogenase/dehydrogenase, beta subunit C-terminal domain [Muribaculum sp.]
MIRITDKKDCVGCNACMQRCPKKCITMHEDEQGFLYPRVDESLCINCGLCEKVCPVINQDDPQKPLEVYAAKNLDDEIRMSSSSGGVFFALAKSVIDEGGVVFGARFNEKWEVVHDCADTLEGIKAFQTSKYVQSRVGDCFTRAEKYLMEGRKVLFTGTPCQLAGLRLFLCKDYGEQLLKVDVVCHGVPSPLVWREYLKYITARPKGALAGKNTDFQSLNGIPALAGISFRDKKFGWEKFGFAVRTSATKGSGENSDLQSAIRQKPEEENYFFFEALDKNLFMQIFLKNLDLRPSCYACPAKCGKAHSDITLADFWGIRRSYPDLYDPKGVSLLLCNTTYGEKTLGKLENISLTEVSYGPALAANPSIEKSVAIPKQYARFWEEFLSHGFATIPRLLARIRPSLTHRILHKIKHILKRLIKSSRRNQI